MTKEKTLLSLTAVLGTLVLIILFVTGSASRVKAAGTEGTLAETVAVSGSYTVYAASKIFKEEQRLSARTP